MEKLLVSSGLFVAVNMEVLLEWKRQVTHPNPNSNSNPIFSGLFRILSQLIHLLPNQNYQNPFFPKKDKTPKENKILIMEKEVVKPSPCHMNHHTSQYFEKNNMYISYMLLNLEIFLEVQGKGLSPSKCITIISSNIQKLKKKLHIYRNLSKLICILTQFKKITKIY